jgi:hypothetical protein
VVMDTIEEKELRWMELMEKMGDLWFPISDFRFLISDFWLVMTDDWW